MRLTGSLSLVLGLLNLVIALPHSNPPAASPLLPTRLIYQFPSNSSINLENIAVRSSGALLVTEIVPQPNIWQIDPSRPSPTLELITTVPDRDALLGIAEVNPDVFVFIAGSIAGPGRFVPGSLEVYEIDLSLRKPNQPVQPRLVSRFQDAACLNGMTALSDAAPRSKRKASVLVGDCTLGQIYRLDTNTGENEVVLSDPPTMLPAPDAPIPIGINGIRYAKEEKVLYYANSFNEDAGLVRVPLKVTPESVSASGQYETVASGVAVDDSALRPEKLGKKGRFAWTTSNDFGLLGVSSVDLRTGESVLVAGGEAEGIVAGSTAAAFGRKQGSKGDEDVLYVVTSRGRVVGVDTSKRR